MKQVQYLSGERHAVTDANKRSHILYSGCKNPPVCHQHHPPLEPVEPVDLVEESSWALDEVRTSEDGEETLPKRFENFVKI